MINIFTLQFSYVISHVIFEYGKVQNITLAKKNEVLTRNNDIFSIFFALSIDFFYKLLKELW